MWRSLFLILFGTKQSIPRNVKRVQIFVMALMHFLNKYLLNQSCSLTANVVYKRSFYSIPVFDFPLVSGFTEK